MCCLVKEREGRSYLEDLDIDIRLLLRRILHEQGGGGGCTSVDMIEVMDQWQAFVSTIMNHWVP
jgi:hypothetical protein